MKYIYLILLLLPLQAFSQISFMFDDTNAWDTLDSPLKIDSLAFWVSAKHSIYSSPLVPATDGDTIWIWKDRSANQIDLDINTNNVTFNSSGGPSGNPCVRFNGGGSSLTSTNTFYNGKDYTIIVLVKFDNSARDVIEYIINKRAPSTNILIHGGGLAYYNYVLTAQHYFPHPQAGLFRSAKTKNTTWGIFTVNYSGTGTSIDFYFDRAASTDTYGETDPSCDGTPTEGTGVMNIGYNLQGDISEIMFFNKFLSTSELQSVWTYLENEWGL